MTQYNLSRVLVISPLELRHRYFIKELLKDRSIDVVSVIVDKSSSKLGIKKYFSFSRFLHAMLSVFELSTLGPVLNRRVPVHRVTSLADTKILSLTNELKPKLIVVYGGKVIPKSTLESLGSPCINIHGSVLPGYRGLDSYWWALIEKNRHLMGYSIHFLEQGIDTGALIKVKPYQYAGQSVLRHFSWRIWIAKDSAYEISQLLKSQLLYSKGVIHSKEKSFYRSKVRLRVVLSRILRSLLSGAIDKSA